MESAVIPYWAAAGWYRHWLFSRLSGHDEETALRHACAMHPADDNRALTRTRFESRGDVFSVPVCGGASALKRQPADQLIVSGHGNWSQSHFRTLGTVYGRSPYFHYFEPRLREIYRQAVGRHFADFSRSIHDLISQTVLPEGVAESFRKALAEGDRMRVLRQRCSAMSRLCGDDAPVCDVLFSYGPEAIFPLAETFLNQYDG